MKKRVILFFTIVVIIFLYILYYFKDTDHFTGAVVYILTLTLFYLADKIFSLEFKKHHYFILFFMATAGILLSPVYFIYPYYDKTLHFFFPFLGSFLIFYLINKLDIDFKTKVFFTFTIIITLITFEEIVEFILDTLFNLKLQGVFLGERILFENVPIDRLIVVHDRITDTMLNLILGTIGAFLFSLMKFATSMINKKPKKIRRLKK